jgi:hypothetical protein
VASAGHVAWWVRLVPVIERELPARRVYAVAVMVTVALVHRSNLGE